MSDNSSKKKSGTPEYAAPPAYDLDRFMDSDSDCDVPSPSKSRKNISHHADVDPPTHDYSHHSGTTSIHAEPPANKMSLDTDMEDCCHVDSDISDEIQRAYTPPSYLAKGRSTFSRYSDLKNDMPPTKVDGEKNPEYTDPPAYNLNHFMDSDTECDNPEKPDKQRMPTLARRAPAKRYSDAEPDIVSSSSHGLEQSPDSSELDDLAILKKANDISEKCYVQGNSNGSVVISKQPTSPMSLFDRGSSNSSDSIPPPRYRKSFRRQREGEDNEEDGDGDDEDSEECGDLLSSLGLSSKNLVVDVNKGKSLHRDGY